MGKYDIALKSAFALGGKAFLRELGVEGPLERLDLELPSVRERRLDFLARTGPDQYLHVEFQTARNSLMAWRMLGYRADIQMRLMKESRSARLPKRKLEVRQALVYIGTEPWNIPRIEQKDLSFGFQSFNVSTMDSRPLLENGDVGDAILGLLCKDGVTNDMIQAILGKIAKEPEAEQGELVAHLPPPV